MCDLSTRVDDSIAVYRELLKVYTPSHIVLYGTSAGAILTAQVVARLKQLGLPLPAALGTGWMEPDGSGLEPSSGAFA